MLRSCEAPKHQGWFGPGAEATLSGCWDPGRGHGLEVDVAGSQWNLAPGLDDLLRTSAEPWKNHPLVRGKTWWKWKRRKPYRFLKKLQVSWPVGWDSWYFQAFFCMNPWINLVNLWEGSVHQYRKNRNEYGIIWDTVGMGWHGQI